MSDASTRIDPEKDRRLGEAVAAYFAAVEAGGEPDRDAILAAYPDLAADLAEFFDQEERLGRIVGPFRSTEPAGVDLEATLAGPADGAGDEATLDLPEVAANGRDDPLARGVRVRYFGDYELSGVLGRGGMGIVYKATQLSLNRVVALKMIRSGHWADDDEVRRFRNEAEAVANLDHPLILPIYEVGRCDEQHYFSMKFVPGGSLESRLGEFQADVRAAAGLVSEVARAVHHAHQRGLLHRDLKPSNILLDAEDRPHVADFGLAKRIEGDDAATISGAIVGSPPYMSPEQASGRGRAVTTSTDVYGLGALLYACLTGVPPFHDDDVAATLRRVIEQPPAAPSRLNPRVDRDLETICLKCLEKDPKRRYDSASALADDLDRWLRGEPIVARRTGGWERALKWSRRRPAAAALVAMSGIAALTLAGLGVALFYQGELKAAKLVAEKALANELRLLYSNRVISANRELRDNNPHRAREFLDQCPVESRQWEWHQLDRQSRGELMTIAAHEDWASDVEFSPDGRLIASAEYGGDVRIWDAETGREVRTHRDKLEGLVRFAFSPDGLRLASIGGTRNRPRGVVIRDVATGRTLPEIPAEIGTNSGLAFSRDGSAVAVASGELATDGWVQIRDAATGAVRLSIPLKGEPGGSPSLSPDGGSLLAVVGSMNGIDQNGPPNEARVWDAAGGALRFTLRGNSAPLLFAKYSLDGRRIVTGGYDPVVRVYDAADGRELRIYTGHRGCVNDVAFNLDGRRVATASDDGSARIWELETGRDYLALRGHRGPFFALAFSPDGRRLATAGNDGAVKVWDATAGPDVTTLDAHRGRADVAFSADGGLLATAGVDRDVKLWEVQTGRLLVTLKGHADPIYAVAFSPDGKHLATAGGDWRRVDGPGEIRIWDVATREALHVLPAHKGVVWALAFSPDGRSFASGGGEYNTPDQDVIVWDVADGRRLRAFTALPRGVTSVAFSPDGRRLTAAAGDVIRTWDLGTGELAATLPNHDERVRMVAYSPDGRQIVSSGTNMTLNVWDAETGSRIQTLRGHKYWVDSFGFSPDARRIASASGDQTVKIWDPETGLELITLLGHSSHVWSLAFSPDGRLIATADDHGLVKIWNGSPLEGGSR